MAIETCIECQGIICIKHPSLTTHRLVGDLKLDTLVQFPQTIERCDLRLGDEILNLVRGIDKCEPCHRLYKVNHELCEEHRSSYSRIAWDLRDTTRDKFNLLIQKTICR